MTGIRVLILDDEPLARRRLRRLLALIPEVQLVAECCGGGELAAVLLNTRVDAMFLDIQIPGEDVFSTLETLPLPLPFVVFVTAHESHAIKAFEVDATDYLLKPISLERLRQATHRLGRKTASRNAALTAEKKATLPSSGPATARPGKENANLLSERETEVLQWAAIGKTSWEISSILHISERTVNFHLGNIANKLGVTGRQAACSIAIAKGFIRL